ncbi:hypothetical protein [Paracoccus denitrificans]|jgi:hypothetical protein|uniref:Uncharacterized protein n=1 Tax=Paracoccus denitrificans (strain Pd 1222) TaxID=318586 RepID=A1B9G0_PARDP|nr:hypothetical protein [Paracoccus denitrificans]ABL72154.1 hypothetical protein Pden_4088 [Paracoccus denitrificans PD1222]MBB4625931.1 hypothetical protein [Paracoccus denitrificans]MCU7426907.1 hypothetical protein [Paracoccus denitrificans]QAR28729.1 hypothetical protein EO213_20830 [Paracoccus denitrificans]UPV96874.1 hypothetical protein M0K93_20915 [Paracoccus denitrificans]
MPDTPHGLLGLIQSGWTQIMAIVGIIWWSRKIDLRTKDHADRLDRHEARLRGIEQQAQAQAILQARIEEALSGIKITLDRIYSQIHERK